MNDFALDSWIHFIHTTPHYVDTLHPVLYLRYPVNSFPSLRFHHFTVVVSLPTYARRGRRHPTLAILVYSSITRTVVQKTPRSVLDLPEALCYIR